jgi:hypothetical protein
MELDQAKNIVGNQADIFLKNMIKALELPISQFLNTPADRERLEAAKIVLKARRQAKRAA